MMTLKIAVTLGMCLLLCTCLVCGTWFQVVKMRAMPSLESRDAEAADSPSRYELKEFRHGSVVGLAMVDRQIGRTWILTGSMAHGSNAPPSFQEVEVEQLWPEVNILDATNPVLPADVRKTIQKQFEAFSRIKGMTRPKAVRDAAQEAARAQAGAASTNPPKQKPN